MPGFPVQSYVPISIGNNSGIHSSSIWIAIYGELIINPGNGIVPAAGPTYYLDATALNSSNQPVPQATDALPPAGPTTPDSVILPGFTLEQWGANLSFPIPAYTGDSTGANNQQFTGRILISVGTPVQAQLNSALSVSAPSPSNPSDPSTGTLYDFLEFTVASNSDGSSNVDIDTSQVDAFGLPVQLQFFRNATATETYDISFTGSTQSGSAVVENLSPTMGLAVGMPVGGGGLVEGSVIISLPAGNDPVECTLNNNAGATAAGVTLAASPAGPVGLAVARSTVFSGASALCFQAFISQRGANAQPFLECNSAAPLRLIAPKDITEALSTAQSTDPLNNYFNAQIDQFFLSYFGGTVENASGTSSKGGGNTFSLQSGASGATLTYSGTVVPVNGNYLLSLTDTSGADLTVYTIYYPFFTTNLPDSQTYVPLFPPAAPPAWITALGKQGESASQMIFACDGVFADNTNRSFTSGTAAAVLGDLENSLSAAFNRGIVMSDPSTWSDSSLWFPANGIYNYWVEYWHQSGLATNGLAYAFPYDDKFGTSTNLQESGLGLVQITLGSWGPQAQATVRFVDFPAAASQGGTTTLTASATGAGTAPTGTITFYIDGYPLNPAGYAGGPQAFPVALISGQASSADVPLPPLPDGAHTHSYTVTAVYSGDAGYQPSALAQTLQLIGTLGDFAVNLDPAQFPVGALVGVTFTLPLASVDGVVTLSLLDSLNNPVPNSSASQNVSAAANTISYRVPADTLTFTGDLTSENSTITDVSSVNNLTPGQGVSGQGVSPGATISALSSSTVSLSSPAAATSTGTVITADATLVTYTLQVVYAPSMAGGETLTGLAKFSFVAGS